MDQHSGLPCFTPTSLDHRPSAFSSQKHTATAGYGHLAMPSAHSGLPNFPPCLTRPVRYIPCRVCRDSGGAPDIQNMIGPDVTTRRFGGHAEIRWRFVCFDASDANDIASSATLLAHRCELILSSPHCFRACSMRRANRVNVERAIKLRSHD